MSTTEGQRHDLHVGLAETIGPDRAETLMSMLPPVGWADVATKQDVANSEALLRRDLEALRGDLKHLETVMTLRAEAMESRLLVAIGDLRTEVHVGQRNLLLGVFGSVLAAAAANQLLAAFL